MATLDDVARQVLAAVDTAAGHLLVAQWVGDRYRQMASRARFRHLRTVGELALPATITAGTVTTTQGARAVVGDATAAAAWSPTIIGWSLRVDVAWYEVTGVLGTTLTLATPIAESGAAGASYTLAKRWHALAADARWLGDVVHMRRHARLPNVSLAELDARDPARRYTSTLPAVWAEVAVNAEGARTLEVYPYVTAPEVLHYVYWAAPPVLDLESLVPPSIEPRVLVEGALIDVFRWEAARAMRAGNLEAAAYWRNESRAQATSWERDILEAIRTDLGVDDVSFVLESSRATPGVGDIRTAEDDVLARWTGLR